MMCGMGLASISCRRHGSRPRAGAHGGEVHGDRTLPRRGGHSLPRGGGHLAGHRGRVPRLQSGTNGMRELLLFLWLCLFWLPSHYQALRSFYVVSSHRARTCLYRAVRRPLASAVPLAPLSSIDGGGVLLLLRALVPCVRNSRCYCSRTPFVTFRLPYRSSFVQLAWVLEVKEMPTEQTEMGILASNNPCAFFHGKRLKKHEQLPSRRVIPFF